MSKHMSKTLAEEIAERVLRVTNPANRPMALNDALRRHGFEPLAMVPDDLPADRAGLAKWLQEKFRIPST
jgi:hypothetical protein